MKSYIEIVKEVLADGETKHNRTGVDTISIAGTIFKHDMSQGFPLLTTKRMSVKNIAVELEFFIKGLKDKKWLQDRGCHIWDEWCNPQKVTYGHCEETKNAMRQERDLGNIYGKQWRSFGYDGNRTSVDQLKNIVDTLKTNPDDRRMICSAWNPLELDKMALPPCHYSWQVTVINGKLNLMWNQRSVDVAIGLPYNIASYAMLLMLLAKESGFIPGKLIGFLGDTHIYTNHVDGLKEQIRREPMQLSTANIKRFTSIFEWEYTDFEVDWYLRHGPIKFDIAV